MRISYNVTGAQRKALVTAIGEELNATAKYLGMPSAAYEVGGYTIDKTGTVTGADNRDLVADLCGLHSFKAVSEEYDTPTPEAEDTTAFEELSLTEGEELGLGQERRDPVGENGMQASDVPEPDTIDSLTIELPMEDFTPEAFDNLCKMVTAKEVLIKQALGTDDLPISTVDGKLTFPWFYGSIDSEHADAYSRFISCLAETAKSKKRVTAKEKNIDGNPKYAMRCFLLSLGFIGDEYKKARKILLSKLDGNSSWKGGRKLEAEVAVSE